ncbi:glycosyltransferase family 39 protein [Actimicrobium sp. CCC2.4]|uniref:ArnT family glycosyltransferase n=1 Tax=Actimicrobium sp. CCC2.4 TaxID=3048606 RepID=UPI002AC99053|nr:glycosyltransferase family 39 protein [Actimicrobium sp. CCC2.4]MEB0134725.1 glycosyltransferase family 39 protein [Actimicrobium sp. CCC2.4]WPX30666.1 glycosyltransferase family 39 protein [Actimicrobium sp. CCC2.4]
MDTRATTGAYPGVADLELAGVLPYALLIIVFIFFGLTGHDPWKADEAYVFGVIHTMLETGNWLIPTIAGEPFMEKPPLYYWVAGACVYIFGGWMDQPDAARMASGLFMAITAWSIAAATRAWWGSGSGRYAPLLLLGCLGTLTQTHMMMPDVPLLAGFALSAWGFSRVLTTMRAGGLLLGVGVGISFLSKGVIGPAVIGITALMLPVCFAEWRTWPYFRGLIIALATSLPMLLVWPFLLYLRSPAMFMVWFWENNFGRFFGFSVVHMGTEHPKGFWLQTLPWFAFPSLPLALYALWRQRQIALIHPAMQYGLVATLVMMLVLSVSESVRAVYALPLLVPLSILAAPSVSFVPHLLERLWVKSSQWLFALLAGVIWLGWVIMMMTGAPPSWPWLLRVLPADFIPEFDLPTFALALSLTGAAWYAQRLFARHPAKGLTSWLTGLTLTWALLTTLWMPWLDYGKSYQQVFSAIPWPSSTGCVASVGMGESERAMLDYVAHRITIRREILPGATCDVLLMQGYATSGSKEVDPSLWEPIWDGARPGDDWQHFWLFRARQSAPISAVASIKVDEKRRLAGF